jgi:organic hydroperoxide reductase OsmC/OhrA
MPARSGAGWSVTWTSHTEHRDEIADEEELRASEHLGCYGSAIAHTLGQAGAAPIRLRVTVETAAATHDSDTTSLVVEVRAQIPGMDQAIFESVARRVEPTCPVWKALAAEVGMRVVAILEDPQAVPSEAPASVTRASAPSRPAPAQPIPSGPRPGLGSLMGLMPSGRLAWLSPKMGLALVGMLVVGVRVFTMMAS